MSGSNSSLKTNSLVLENTGLRAWDIALPLLLLGISVVLLFLAVPYGADLWWSDATRHAMDGAFIFDMRLREDRRDLSVLRAAKLLLRVKQRRDLGVEQKNVTEAETAEMLNRYGVSYVVDQPNFWDDLKNMRQLQRVLHTKQFQLVDTIARAAECSSGAHPAGVADGGSRNGRESGREALVSL